MRDAKSMTSLLQGIINWYYIDKFYKLVFLNHSVDSLLGRLIYLFGPPLLPTAFNYFTTTLRVVELAVVLILMTYTPGARPLSETVASSPRRMSWMCWLNTWRPLVV